jgi:hypothetical protein
VRNLGKILGWIVTLLIVLLGVALVVATQLGVELGKRWLGNVFRPPDWVAWLIVGGFAAFFAIILGVVVFGPKNRAAWRQARRAARERRRKLRNFELADRFDEPPDQP